MHARITIVAVALVCGSGLLVWAGDATDKQKLQGMWKVVGGMKEAHSLAFDGDKFVLTFNEKRENKMVTASGTFKIEPAKKPKTIDMRITGGTFENYKGKISLGIYELNGDKLKWLANEPGLDERPKAFPQEKVTDRKLLFVILEREKK